MMGTRNTTHTGKSNRPDNRPSASQPLAFALDGTTPAPTAREINKRLRQERELEKRLERQEKHTSGAAAGVISRILKKHPGNPHEQVSMFLREFVIHAGVGRKRPVSAATSTKYRHVLHSILNDLRTYKMPVQNISEIGRAHAMKLVAGWMKDGLSAATIQNRISIMRRFLQFMGKTQAIPEHNQWRELLNANGMEAPERRSTVATVSKAWDENGVDYKEVVQRVIQICPLTAVQLAMQLCFGLRVRESLEIDPKAADYGDMLRILYGTKGGRPRDVPFSSDEGVSLIQRDVLERAKTFAREHAKGRLGRKGYTLEQNARHFYHVLERAGVQRKTLGISAHGLRHQYMGHLYTEESGLPPPVSRNAKLSYTEDDLANHRRAVRIVQNRAGHGEEKSSGAYIGSHGRLESIRNRRVDEWIRMLEGNPRFHEECLAAGVQELWLGGYFAHGVEVRPDDRIELSVRFSTVEGAQTGRLHLKQKLGEIYPRGVNIIPWIVAEQPEPCVALHLKDPAKGKNATKQLEMI